MALQSSGIIKLSEIQGEFGGNNPISMQEYYRNGAYVTGNNPNIPTSGKILMSNFYGTTRLFVYSITTSLKEIILSDYLRSNGWDGNAPVNLTINNSVYLWSDNTSIPGVRTGVFPNGLIINNYGNIIGRGGDGGAWEAGKPGGTALELQTAVDLFNYGYVAGGGGGGGSAAVLYGNKSGGGGGAGGGRGADSQSGSGGAGGAIGQPGADGTGYGTYGRGGGAGGGGSGGSGLKGTDTNGGGGGGGRILPGVGGSGGKEAITDPGGNGGSAGNVGQNAPGRAAAGGGGWGAAGGFGGGFAGGSGGPAIKKNNNTLNLGGTGGTIYGGILV